MKKKKTKKKPKTKNQKTKLTPLQERFCLEYVKNGNNATQATLFVKPHVTYHTARFTGAEYLAKPYIKERIRELEEDIQQSQRLGIEHQLQELTKLRNLTEDERLKLSIIQEQNKMLGNYAPEKKQIKHEGIEAIKIEFQDGKD